MEADVPLPRYVQVEAVGERCTGAHALMGFDAFCRLADQFGPSCELSIESPGEPLLHPRFFDMVRYAAGRDILVSATTGMAMLSDSRAQECIRSGLHTLRIRIDAAGAGAREAIRARRFDKVLRNLRRLIATRIALGSELPHVDLIADTARCSVQQVLDVVRLASAEGARSLALAGLGGAGEAPGIAVVRGRSAAADGACILAFQRPAHDSAESIGDTAPAADNQAAAMRDQARAEARRLALPLRLPDPVQRLHGPATPARATHQRCTRPWRGAYIGHDGQARPCDGDAARNGVVFGNMTREGVARVWNSPPYKAFRAALSAATPAGVCRGCAQYLGAS